MELTVDKLRDRIHRPGPVQGNDCRQIFDRLGLHPDAHAGDARRLQLENTRRPALAQHGEGLSVVVRDMLHRKVRRIPADLLHRVINDRQVAQAQKIHLEQAQLLNGRHRELGDDGIIIPGQRDIIAHRPLGDDDTSGVGRGIAGHPLNGPGRIHQLFNPLIAVIELPQLRRDAQCLVQRHMQCRRNLLGDDIRLRISKIHHAAHIPDGGPGGH